MMAREGSLRRESLKIDLKEVGGEKKKKQQEQSTDIET